MLIHSPLLIRNHARWRVDDRRLALDMALTCLAGLTRAKSTLKSLFRNKSDDKEPPQSTSSSSSKKRQTRFFGGSRLREENSAEPIPPSPPIVDETKPTAEAPKQHLQHEQKEPEEDIAAAVLSAGDNAGGHENAESQKQNPEATKEASRPPSNPSQISINKPFPEESASSPSQAVHDDQETTAELATNQTHQGKPTSAEIEDAEVEEAQAAVKASEARGPPAAANADVETAKQSGTVLKTAVGQAGAAGSMMGMSATSGPLSDQPALA